MNRNGSPTYASDGGFNAFREAAFGVAGLKILNDTHAHYSWHRHSCDEGANLGAANNYGLNFSVSCATKNDNGGLSMVTTDQVYIVRQPASICPLHWGQTISSSSSTSSKKSLRGEKGGMAAAEVTPALAEFEFTHAAEKKGARVGENYVRPQASDPILPTPKSKHASPDTSACGASEQIHISLGNDDNSVVVSYISSALKGEVRFSTDKKDLLKDSSSAYVTTVEGGVGVSSSQLRLFNPKTIYPHLGANTSSIDIWANIADTTAWAHDADGSHWGQYLAIKASTLNQTFANLMKAYYAVYLNPNGGSTGTPILQYTNPYAFYDSSIKHTVTLDGLTAGTTYYYRVDGSCKIYSFKVSYWRSKYRRYHLSP